MLIYMRAAPIIGCHFEDRAKVGRTPWSAAGPPASPPQSSPKFHSRLAATYNYQSLSSRAAPIIVGHFEDRAEVGRPPWSAAGPPASPPQSSPKFHSRLAATYNYQSLSSRAAPIIVGHFEDRAEV